ncbi:MAG: endonuclease [Phycisphaeraceae bacterium]|nr:endonuclease [Phycisphaeraceae bacterium]
MPQAKSRCRRAIAPVLALFSLAAAGAALADQYDPPAGYYSTATGTGAALELQLHNIIDGHFVRSYDDARQALPLLDPDPSIPGNILLIYNGQSVSGAWDAGITWNREHTWPRSRGIDTTGPDNSDLHQLRGCNPSINSSRGNKPFRSPTDATYWDPGQLDPNSNGFRGEIARAMFYLDVRYDGSEANTTDLELVNGFPGTNQMGDLASLLTWHYEQPVAQRERRRNHLIYSSADNPQYFQGNRNPFVDHPEYVWALWGPTPNNSTLFVGANPAGDGSSNAMIDLGRVIVGSAPGSTNVSVMKIGANPTTWEAIASGDLDASSTLERQAFTTGAQMASIPLSLSPGVSPGLVSGMLVINNTDLTSAGAGQGVNDADDLVHVFATAVDHAAGSFDAGMLVTTLDVDFGDVDQGSIANTMTIDLFNLGADPLLTADLVVGTINGSGDTSEINIDLVFGTVVSALSGASFDTTIDTNAPLGPYSASFTINIADEAIPGAASGMPLTLNVSANLVLAGCSADINGDGVVDTADLGQMLSAFGASGPGLLADLNGDQIVDTADLGILLGEFGMSCN